MNAQDYLDQQLSGQPTSQGMNASAYLDAQLAPPKPPESSSTEKLLTYANSPFSGLMNAGVDTALGATQAAGGLLHAVHILPDTLNIGGLDVGYNAGNQGINDIEKIKGQENAEAMQNNLPAKAGYMGGDIAGNMALFSALGGTSAPSTTGIQGAVSKLPYVGKTLASVMPAADAGGLTSFLQPAQDMGERSTNAAWGTGLAVGGKLLGDALSSQVTDPTKQVALKTAEDFNIPVYRSQVSDNPLAKAVASFEKDIPGSGATSAMKDQVGKFNSAVLGTIGQTGDAVTPETLKTADDAIGKVYTDMTSKYDLPVNSNFEDELLKLNDAVPTLGDQAKEHALQSQVNNVMSKIKDGVIDGKTYQGIRSKIGGLLRGQNGSPELGQLQDLLDTHFQGAMAPEDAQLFQQARGQYRNMLAIERVVANNPNEAISPSKLQGAVKNVFGNYAYSGSSDLERLARLGNVLKDSFPNSGTATRSQLYELAKHVAGPAIGVGVGAGEGYREGGGEGAVLGALAGYGANKFGITPYLYSAMSKNPSLVQGYAPALANALANYKTPQGGQQ